MILNRPALLIFIGFLLVLMGVVIPWLIVLKYLPSTFFLNFFSYGASVLGIYLGLIGTAMYVKDQRRKER
jgi:uncharacterized membrane protein